MFKKKIYILIISICTIFTNMVYADSYDGPSPRGEVAYIEAKDNYANIRKGAGTQYDLICKFDNGTEVEVFGSIKNKKGQKWYCINLTEKNIHCGWTHESNIKFDKNKK